MKNSQHGNGKFEFRARLRESLDADGLDSKLKGLDKSTNMMSRLRISGQTAEQHGPVQNRLHKCIILVLEVIRNSAKLMRSVLCRSWSDGCYGRHSVNLYLQAATVHLEKNPTLGFQMCFRGMEVGSGTETLLLERLIVGQRLELSPQLPVRRSLTYRGFRNLLFDSSRDRQ